MYTFLMVQLYIQIFVGIEHKTHFCMSMLSCTTHLKQHGNTMTREPSILLNCVLLYESMCESGLTITKGTKG